MNMSLQLSPIVYTSSGSKVQMFRVPYRWFSSYFWRNIESCYYDLYNGIKNILRWIPIIWFDRDWDWVYLSTIMEFKLRKMSEEFAKYGHHLNNEKQVQETLLCANLLKRIREDAYVPCYSIEQLNREDAYVPCYSIEQLKKADIQRSEDLKLFGKIIGRKMMCWWD